MKFKAEITMDNTPSGDYPTIELARTIENLADRVYFGDNSGTLTDTNGNSVGQWEITNE